MTTIEERDALAAAAGLPRSISQARYWRDTGVMTEAQYDAFMRVYKGPIQQWQEAHPGEELTLRMVDPVTGKPQEPPQPDWLDSWWLTILVFLGAILLAAIGWPALGG